MVKSTGRTSNVDRGFVGSDKNMKISCRTVRLGETYVCLHTCVTLTCAFTPVWILRVLSRVCVTHAWPITRVWFSLRLCDSCLYFRKHQDTNRVCDSSSLLGILNMSKYLILSVVAINCFKSHLHLSWSTNLIKPFTSFSPILIIVLSFYIRTISSISRNLQLYRYLLYGLFIISAISLRVMTWWFFFWLIFAFQRAQFIA